MSDHSTQDPSNNDVNPSPFETFKMSESAPAIDPIDLLLARSEHSCSVEFLSEDTENHEPVGNQQETLTPSPAMIEPVAVKLVAVEPVVAAIQPVAISGSESEPATVSDEPRFIDLALRDEVQEAVKASGYDKPTAIQSEIIPHMLAGRDVLAQSQTGTGKTAAFALPILSRIEIGRKKPQVLVLTPTRELAIQVAKSFSTYAGSLKGFSVAAIYGGSDYSTQFRQLQHGVEVVVGTPGRVIDHIKRGTLDLSELKCLVLDEADEMLNMGFLDDVKFVLEHTPNGRQVALFSATLPPPIRTIAQQYLNDPARITIKMKTMTADSIRQRALFVMARDKVDVLKRLLEVEETDGVIIFTNTKDASVTIAEQLNREGLSAIALNGDMPQKTRERTIEQLKAGHLNILVATDVAARGLDVTRVSHVFNFDVPQDSESYIHRIGRTGRAGRNGEAIIFLTNAQRGRLKFIERATKQEIEIVQPPTADDINAIRIKRFTQRIAETAAGHDLTIFETMITQFAEESETPIVKIAAALAQIGQQGRPFLVKDQPRRKEFERSESRGDRVSRGSTPQRARNAESGKPDSRQIGPPAAGKDRYRIEIGWNDGVKVGNIVGAIANEGGIGGEHIGPIKIHDSFATVDLPAGMPREIFNTLQRTRVAGKPMQMTLANDATAGPAARPARTFKKDGPRRPGEHAGKVPSRSKSVDIGKHKKRKHRTQPQD